MSETTATRTVLYEAAQIKALRTKLREASYRITREGQRDEKAFDYGVLTEAIDTAETALFNVLNVAGNLLGCDESAAALVASRAKAEAAREAS